MAITIRHIEEKDNFSIAQTIKTVFREFKIDQPGTVYTDPTTDNLFSLFQTPLSEYFIAEEDGVIVGGCGIFPTIGLPDGCTELVKFYLASSARGKGTGNKLMQQSIEAAKRLKYKKLYLESLPELGKAVKMYEKSGFKQIEKPIGDSGHYACTIWMLKDL
ncbi:MAG: GNAT family N-acetyltransferase [Bacteroidota bacterium]|nr:GNAT family N-acetyltransferase [Bacteroidota bacterium]